jgi:hypothetical protein
VKVLFQNRQWAVTDYGVESVKPAPSYNFTAERLVETADYGAGDLYSWLVHMAEKTWVDIEAFIEAFTKALELHANKYSPRVDPDLLLKSLTQARREAKER